MKDKRIVVKVDIRLEKIIPKFIAHQKQAVADIRNAFEQRRYQHLARLGHNIRGTCGGYGFFELGEMGNTIESAAIAQDDEKLRNQISSMEDYLERVEIHYQNIA